jgi:hypothetical protein
MYVILSLLEDCVKSVFKAKIAKNIIYLQMALTCTHRGGKRIYSMYAGIISSWMGKWTYSAILSVYTNFFGDKINFRVGIW